MTISNPEPGLRKCLETKTTTKEELKMAEQTELKTNHNVSVVNLATGQNVLCIFGEIRSEDEEKRVVGYRLFIHSLFL